MNNKLIGKKVRIKKIKDNWFSNNWAIIIAFDGEYFTVRMNNGKNNLAEFTRKEVIISKI